MCAGPQLIADLANVLSEVESSFEPRFNGGAAVAAGIAAAPPLLFWFTVWTNAQRAIKKAEDKEQARLVSLQEMACTAGCHVMDASVAFLTTFSHLVVPVHSRRWAWLGSLAAKVHREQHCNAATRCAAFGRVSMTTLLQQHGR